MTDRNTSRADTWINNSFLNQEETPPTPPKKSKRKGLVITVIILAVILVITLCAAVFITYKIKQTTILENVSIAGVDLGGMTKEQAEEALTAAINERYTSKDVHVKVMDKEYIIPASLFGGTLNVEEVVTEARRFGNFTDSDQRKQEQQLAATKGYIMDLRNYMPINEAGLKAFLQECANDFNQELVNTTWEIKGSKPTDEQLKAGEIDMELVITIGKADYAVDPEKMYQMVIDSYNIGIFEVEVPYETTEPSNVDVDSIYEEHSTQAVDAHLHPETYAFVEECNGYGFDVNAVKKQLENAEYGETITAKFELYEAKYSVEELKADLFKDTLATTTAKNSSQGGRDENLRLACASINGYILNPGEVFDYNEVLGERTTERGYKSGAAYQGGKTVYVTGGGICQVSSTLYSSVVIADLEIVTRENHGYAVGYLPLGIDATVSWGGPEFRFRNNSERPIMIEASSEYGTVTVSIRGIDDKDYYVKFEYEVLATYGWTTVYETMKADNPEGHKDGDVLTTPYTGYETKTYRAKYDKKTDKLISRELEAHSFYNKRDKVVVKIEGAAAEPEPTTPTEPAPTEPAPTEPVPTTPTEPTPTEPTPTEPTPSEPTPTEPAPTDPAPEATTEPVLAE